MKLELKHLAPYLPYGIKVLRPDNRTILEIEGVASGLLIFSESTEPEWTYGELNRCKLILRKLSDLTKEIEHNGERFIPAEKLWTFKLKTYDDYKFSFRYDKHENHILCIRQDTGNQYDLVNLDYYWNREKLFEWHFDCFNLLNNNLAVDYNKIYK